LLGLDEDYKEDDFEDEDEDMDEHSGEENLDPDEMDL
jgi:hypothetical protein